MIVLRILLAAVMVLARLLPFLIVAGIVYLLWRRSARKRQDPDFKGPVYTVDYREVEDEGEERPE